MKLVYHGNILNYHIKPVCDELYKLLGDGFRFLLHSGGAEKFSLKNERGDKSEGCPYAVDLDASEENALLGKRLIEECDVLMTLEVYCIYYQKRMRENKPIIFYSERIFKPSMRKPYHPKKIAYMLLFHLRYCMKRCYMLCVSGYLPCDLNIYHAYHKKMFKWAYFTECDRIGWEELALEKKHDIVKILWVGRPVECKHPEVAIRVANYLKQEGIKFEMHLAGERNNKIIKLVKTNHIEDSVFLDGQLSQEEVRQQMREANIFLFTSDYEEGWGAVLNEAMNEGCAVVVSHAVGAAPFLVKHGVNGYIYDGMSEKGIEDLQKTVVYLCQNPEVCLQLGKKANETILKSWSPQIGARNLVEFSNEILQGKVSGCKDGPCSTAEVIPQKMMYQVLTGK